MYTKTNTSSHCKQKQTLAVIAHKNKHHQSLHTKTNTSRVIGHCTQKQTLAESLHTETKTLPVTSHNKHYPTSHFTQQTLSYQSLHTTNTISHWTQKQTLAGIAHKNKHHQSLHTKTNTSSHCTQKQKLAESLHTKTNTSSHCTRKQTLAVIAHRNKHHQSLHTDTNTSSHCTQKQTLPESLHTTNTTSHCTQKQTPGCVHLFYAHRKGHNPCPVKDHADSPTLPCGGCLVTILTWPNDLTIYNQLQLLSYLFSQLSFTFSASPPPPPPTFFLFRSNFVCAWGDILMHTWFNSTPWQHRPFNATVLLPISCACVESLSGPSS